MLIGAPLFGCLSDHIASRKKPLLLGILVLIASHLTLWFAPTLAGLIVGRLLQGMSAGIVWCVGLALIADVCPSEKVAKMLGYATTAYSVGGFGAPLAGGALYDKLGYSAVFVLGLVFIVLDITFRFLLIEPKRAVKKSFEGTVYVNSGTLPQTTVSESSLCEKKDENHQFDLFFVRNNQNAPKRRDSTSTEQTLYSKTSSTLTEPRYSNTWQSRLKRYPFSILLKSKRMQINFTINIVVSMIISGLNVTLALFVKKQFHWNSQSAGLIYLALAVPAILQMVYGHLVDKFGPRWPASAGILICIAPLAVFRFVESDTINDKVCSIHASTRLLTNICEVLLCALMALIGIGVSQTLAATMAEFAFIAVEKEQRKPGSMGSSGAYAQSYSIFNMSWAIGAIAGSNFAGKIHDNGGWCVVGYAYAGLAGGALIVTVLGCGGWIGSKKHRSNQEKPLAVDSTEHLV